jgi:hypothetical protein
MELNDCKLSLSCRPRMTRLNWVADKAESNQKRVSADGVKSDKRSVRHLDQNRRGADECALGNLGPPLDAFMEFFRLRACGFRRIGLLYTEPRCVSAIRLRSLAQTLRSSSPGALVKGARLRRSLSLPRPRVPF